jgi:hypothetical protein
MSAPREVKLAILLSWIVLILDTGNTSYIHIMQSTPSDGVVYRVALVGITLANFVIVAMSIFFASRRHNWARILLLALTLGSWALWFIYPLAIADYSFWKVLVAVMLVLAELIALVLLFFGKGGQWYAENESAL